MDGGGGRVEKKTHNKDATLIDIMHWDFFQLSVAGIKFFVLDIAMQCITGNSVRKGLLNTT